MTIGKLNLKNAIMIQAGSEKAGYFAMGFLLLFLSMVGCMSSEITIAGSDDFDHYPACWDVPILATDSVFEDYDLFTNSPRCPIRGDDFHFPYIKAVSSHDNTIISAHLSEGNYRTFEIVHHDGYSTFSDTLFSNTRVSKVMAKLHKFYIGKEHILGLDYESNYGFPYRWYLTRAKIVDQQFVGWESSSFDKLEDPLEITAWDVARLPWTRTDILRFGEKENTYTYFDCYTSTCDSAVTRIVKKRDFPDRSHFWYWFVEYAGNLRWRRGLN